MKKKRKRFDAGALVREIARDRIGNVPASKVIVPKADRAKPKHKKSFVKEMDSE